MPDGCASLDRLLNGIKACKILSKWGKKTGKTFAKWSNSDKNLLNGVIFIKLWSKN